MNPWKVIDTATAEDGATVELRYAEFGKGRAKARYWRIYRDGEQAGYGATADDAKTNFARVLAGLVRNPATGNYEPIQKEG